MERLDDSHIPSELLERYAVHGIPDERPEITNHLMACDLCGEVYEEELRRKKLFAEASDRSANRSPQQYWFAFARPVWVGAAALICFMIATTDLQRRPEPGQIVEIAAVRGTETIQARAGVPLVLRLDTTGLELPSKVPVTLVTSTGRAVWTGSAHQVNHVWEANTGQGLARGTYWVRIPDPAQPGETLREFQLVVQ
jgi:hypothetical protein